MHDDDYFLARAVELAARGSEAGEGGPFGAVIVRDGKIVAEVRDAPCLENEMFIALPDVRCTSVELVIPGRNGLVSPAIHECQIFGDFPAFEPANDSPQVMENGS